MVLARASAKIWDSLRTLCQCGQVSSPLPLQPAEELSALTADEKGFRLYRYTLLLILVVLALPLSACASDSDSPAAGGAVRADQPAPTPAPTQAQPQAAASPAAASARPSLATATPTQAAPIAAASSPAPQPQATSQPPSATEPAAQFGNEVNDLAHPFTLPSVDGPSFSLEAERGRKSVVLVFYRAYW